MTLGLAAVYIIIVPFAGVIMVSMLSLDHVFVIHKVRTSDGYNLITLVYFSLYISTRSFRLRETKT